MSSQLARQIASSLQPSPRLSEITTGVVISTGAGGVTVDLDGTTLEDLSYVGTLPGTADVVLLGRTRRQVIVLGTIKP